MLLIAVGVLGILAALVSSSGTANFLGADLSARTIFVLGVIAGVGGFSSFIGAVVATRATTRWGIGRVAIVAMLLAAVGNAFIPLAPAGLPLVAIGCLVLQQLADLSEREPRVVAEVADELKAGEVRGVVEPIVAVGPGGRLEQADLLVIADRPRRQAGLGRDLVDPKEPRLGGSIWSRGRDPGTGHLPPIIPQP